MLDLSALVGVFLVVVSILGALTLGYFLGAWIERGKDRDGR